MDQIYENGMRIQEAEIVKHLLPDMKSQVVHVGIVQKQTDAGEMTRFNALVAVGNEAGWFGIGKGKASQMRISIDKATNAAYLNVIPVKLGCGSWECKCNQQHSVPFKVRGKGGSVTIDIIPGPRGLGLVAGVNIKNLLKLAGTKGRMVKVLWLDKHNVVYDKSNFQCSEEHLQRRLMLDGISGCSNKGDCQYPRVGKEDS